MIPVDYRALSVEELKVNPWEVANRLHVSRDFKSEEIEACLDELKKVVTCKFSAVRMPVVRIDERTLDCGFGEFWSETLLKNLKDSGEVFIFAATIGMGVDRLLTKLSATSKSKYFITDALASALADALADKTEGLITNGINHRPRFSPGFGDLKIELQPKILELVNAQRLLGITINRSYLMSPMKSVTAFIGIT